MSRKLFDPDDLVSNSYASAKLISDDLNNNFEDVYIDKAGVYPEWFGATGDGETDDTKSFQRAVDTNNPLKLAEGTFLLSDEIVLTKSIIGAGQGTVLLVDGSTTLNGALKIDGNSDITIENLKYLAQDEVQEAYEVRQ